MNYRITCVNDYDAFFKYIFKKSSFISVCTLKKVHQKHLNSSYWEFFETMKPYIIEPLKIEIAPYQHYTSGQKFHYFALSNQLKEFILSQKTFWAWIRPDLPEDLSFYNGKSPWLYSISHENLIYINTSDLTIPQDFKEMGCNLSLN